LIESDKAKALNNAQRLLVQLNASMSDDAELCDVLGQIKLRSQAQPAILPYFTEDIGSLIGHEAKGVRNHAYELLLKILRHDPNSSSRLVMPYIACLEATDPSVAGQALEKLPDVAPLAQEQLSTILPTAFNLGCHSNLNVTTHICDTLNILNGLSGH
jgi:hypothetical protein